MPPMNNTQAGEGGRCTIWTFVLAKRGLSLSGPWPSFDPGPLLPRGGGRLLVVCKPTRLFFPPHFRRHCTEILLQPSTIGNPAFFVKLDTYKLSKSHPARWVIIDTSVLFLCNNFTLSAPLPRTKRTLGRQSVLFAYSPKNPNMLIFLQNTNFAALT